MALQCTCFAKTTNLSSSVGIRGKAAVERENDRLQEKMSMVRMEGHPYFLLEVLTQIVVPLACRPA